MSYQNGLNSALILTDFVFRETPSIPGLSTEHTECAQFRRLHMRGNYKISQGHLGTYILERHKVNSSQTVNIRIRSNLFIKVISSILFLQNWDH